MTTKFTRKNCDRCGERTRHKIETNAETGWRRERCMDCWQRAMEASR